MTVEVRHGDCLDVMRALAADGVTVESIVCDPPYHLQSIVKRFAKSGRTDSTRTTSGPHQRTANGFMGQQWDGGDIAFRPETWELALALLKPGGYLFAFGGTRTYHRMACAIEDAGFVIRDQFGWAFGSGFPKSHDIAKAIDKAAGVKGGFGAAKTAAHQRYIDKGEMRGDQGHEGWQRPWMDDPEAVANAGRGYLPGSPEAAEWDGWGTSVKPAWEPVCLAQKPIEGTFAANVLKYGVGGLHIDACRVGVRERPKITDPKKISNVYSAINNPGGKLLPDSRWPANLVHDGSDEVLTCFPDSEGQQRAVGPEHGAKSSVNVYGDYGAREHFEPRRDSGSAARFFYCAKAGPDDRVSFKRTEVIIKCSTLEVVHFQVTLLAVTARSHEKVIAGSESTACNEWSTFLFGNGLMALFRKASKSTIRTKTNSITDLTTWSWLTRSLTKDFILDAKSSTAPGLSHADRADNPNLLISFILAETALLPNARNAPSGALLEISATEKISAHPTVKPVDLIRWLARLVTPRGGTILDPFAGSGTLGVAAIAEGFNAILIEREAEYVADIRERLAFYQGGARHSMASKNRKRAPAAATDMLRLMEDAP